MSETATCPECAGEGEIQGYGCPGFRKISIVCGLCKGKKVVASHVLRWMALGEQLRLSRRARGKTLREEAKERGISASDLSDMERGIQEPILRK